MLRLPTSVLLGFVYALAHPDTATASTVCPELPRNAYVGDKAELGSARLPPAQVHEVAKREFRSEFNGPGRIYLSAKQSFHAKFPPNFIQITGTARIAFRVLVKEPLEANFREVCRVENVELPGPNYAAIPIYRLEMPDARYRWRIETTFLTKAAHPSLGIELTALSDRQSNAELSTIPLCRPVAKSFATQRASSQWHTEVNIRADPQPSLPALVYADAPGELLVVLKRVTKGGGALKGDLRVFAKLNLGSYDYLEICNSPVTLSGEGDFVAFGVTAPSWPGHSIMGFSWRFEFSVQTEREADLAVSLREVDRNFGNPSTFQGHHKLRVDRFGPAGAATLAVADEFLCFRTSTGIPEEIGIATAHLISRAHVAAEISDSQGMLSAQARQRLVDGVVAALELWR
jgi:hypothetical protein